MSTASAGRRVNVHPPVLSEDIMRIALEMICVRPWVDDALWHKYCMIGRRAWLADTLTVSRVWYIAGLPILYRAVELNPKQERRIDLLLRTLRLQPALARYIHVLRPCVRSDQVALQHQSTSRDRTLLPLPGIPFVTAKGRARQATARRLRKLRAVLSMCSNSNELVMDAEDLSSIAPSLAVMAAHLKSIGFQDAGRVDMAQFGRVADWSALRKLRLDASSSSWVRCGGYHEEIPSFDVSIFAPMTRLVALELLGWTGSEFLLEILTILRGSLRSLACNQPFAAMPSTEWLAPVRNSLTTLVLYIGYETPLNELSSLTAVKSLKLILISERRLDLGTEQRTGRMFPPSLQEIEWDVWSGAPQQQLSERWTRPALGAFDSGWLPKLRTLRLRIDIRYSPEIQRWKDTVSSLSNVCEMRGLMLEPEYETNFNCVGTPDVFASAAWVRHQEREFTAKWVEMQRTMDLSLWAPANDYTAKVGCFIRDLAYYIAYISYCCCHFARLWD